jgi:hypothetical protein
LPGQATTTFVTYSYARSRQKTGSATGLRVHGIFTHPPRSFLRVHRVLFHASTAF